MQSVINTWGVMWPIVISLMVVVGSLVAFFIGLRGLLHEQKRESSILKEEIKSAKDKADAIEKNVVGLANLTERSLKLQEESAKVLHELVHATGIQSRAVDNLTRSVERIMDTHGPTILAAISELRDAAREMKRR